MSKIKTVLQFEKPTPPPWRTDIENAPRDGRKIFISNYNGYCYVVNPLDGLDYYSKVSRNQGYTWGSMLSGIFRDNEIAYWMLIPELPKP